MHVVFFIDFERSSLSGKNPSWKVIVGIVEMRCWLARWYDTAPISFRSDLSFIISYLE